MAIYALGITPITMMMIELVTTQSDNRKIVGFADGFSATVKFKFLLQWWTGLLEVGPKFVFFPEPTKLWLITHFETYGLGKKFSKILK